MRAIIPVAGVGTRLRPHTYTLPKVLLNVAGKPILGHILDELQSQGVYECTLVVGYMGDLVEEYVRQNYDFDATFIYQKERQGLGHAIWLARETFGTDPIVIILGDTIFQVDLAGVFSSDRSSLGVKEVEDPRRFGVAETTTDGCISALVEKPERPATNLALVGLYFVKETQELTSCLEKLVEDNVRTRGEYQLTDALQMMIDRGVQFTTFPVEGWYDCGKPETLLSTNKYLLESKKNEGQVSDGAVIPPVYISPSARVERSIIGPYATIADDAVVSDSIVRNSIVSSGAIVERSMLEESIIGNSASVRGHYRRVNVGDSSEIDFSSRC